MRDFLTYLEALGETHIDFDFKRSVRLNKLFYKKLPVITICGTNGKGSTTAFLENILIEAGYRVGAYTSPHLEHVCERIRIQGKKISVPMIEKYGSTFQKKLRQKKIKGTYFEVLTFLALDIFENEKLDVAIFEVGLGGRLDSTNAIPRIGAILTSVSLDHQERLGPTLTHIANEKLPVLKNAPFSVTAKQTAEVEKVIHQTLKKKFQSEGRDFFHSGSQEMFLYQQPSLLLGPLELGIRGDHQSSNASCAIRMSLHLQEIGWAVSVQSIVNGIRFAQNPGRIELWTNDEGHQIWLDVAHNMDSVEKLVHYFDGRRMQSFETVFGVSNDKPFEQMIDRLQRITKQFHFVSIPSPRSWQPQGKTLADPVATVEHLIEQKRFPILSAGSFYHLGEIRRKLPKLKFFRQTS